MDDRNTPSRADFHGAESPVFGRVSEAFSLRLSLNWTASLVLCSLVFYLVKVGRCLCFSYKCS